MLGNKTSGYIGIKDLLKKLLFTLGVFLVTTYLPPYLPFKGFPLDRNVKNTFGLKCSYVIFYDDLN